jgi:hypothetical protein
LLLDAAALRLRSPGDPDGREAAAQRLRLRLREREQQCVRALLERYRFSPSVFPHHALPLEGERWGMDLFNPESLKVFGIQVGKGLATGAMAGASLDALTGGLSLGAATLLGALIGGTWQGAGQWGRRLMGRLSGEQELTVDDPVLQLLGVRQLALVRALEGRGHAALEPIAGELPAGPMANGPARLPDAANAMLQEARSHPHWSTLNAAASPDARRDTLVDGLARVLLPQL